jgi:hypothetical protein
MYRLLVTTFVTAIALSAQVPADWPPPKVIELKHASADAIRHSGVLNPFIQQMNVDPTGRYVVLTATTKERLTAAEELLRRLDVPQKNIELTFHIIASGPAGDAAVGTIPAELQSVVTQLRSTFAFPGYRVLETAVVRTRDGSSAEIDGAIAGFGNYGIRFRPIRLSEGAPWQVRLDGLQLRQQVVRYRAEKVAETDSASLKADVDVREGQKVVVGKSTMRESAIFLVVSVRVTN